MPAAMQRVQSGGECGELGAGVDLARRADRLDEGQGMRVESRSRSRGCAIEGL